MNRLLINPSEPLIIHRPAGSGIKLSRIIFTHIIDYCGPFRSGAISVDAVNLTAENSNTVAGGQTLSGNENYKITKNQQYGSVEVRFNAKPSDAVRDVLKSHKFKWNKNKGVWYSYGDISAVDKALSAAYNESNSNIIAESEQPVYEIGGKVSGTIDISEYDKRIAAAAEKYNMEDGESYFLTRYVGGYAYEWNQVQRDASDVDIDPYLQEFYRNIESALKKIPEYSGRTYMNLQFAGACSTKTSYNDFLTEYSPGKDITLQSFTSASKDPNGYPVSGEKLSIL